MIDTTKIVMICKGLLNLVFYYLDMVHWVCFQNISKISFRIVVRWILQVTILMDLLILNIYNVFESVGTSLRWTGSVKQMHIS